jgi:HEAT repeat protein
VRRKAIELLGSVGPSAGDAIARLVELLADEDEQSQALAEQALKRISPSWNQGRFAKEAVPALSDKLAANDWRLRRNAADVLGRLGDSGREAVPALLRRLEDRHEYVRLSAQMALDHIEPDWRHQVFEMQAVEQP